MRIEVYFRGEPDKFPFYDLVSSVANSIKGHLESSPLLHTSDEPTSKKIRFLMDEFFSRHNWIRDFKVDSSIPESEPNTNYKLDAIKDIETESNVTLRLLFESCFDNRQAIGTNLLKFAVAKREYKGNSRVSPQPILLVADKSNLRKYGWDGSIASFEEYELAIRDPYAEILELSPIFLVIRD